MPARRVSGFLRAEPSRFLGRATELARLDAPLIAGKLALVVGPSGIGKTRLALRYGITRHAKFAGVWFCDVSEARDVEEMTTMIRRRLSATAGTPASSAAASASALERALAARAGALVIIDNLEHLLPAATAVVRGWIRAAPEVRFIVTSRVPLGIGEEVVELGSLELPPPGTFASDAVDLFVDRVRTHRGTYAPADHELARIADLVQSLNGVPLAIELAAARFDDGFLPDPIRGFGSVLPPALAKTGSREDDAERAIDRGFAVLPPAEQQALCQASVFRGSFTLAAAARVVRLDGARVEDVIATLARKSLLHVERHEPLRFAMSESIRSYAARRLSFDPDQEAPQRRHAALLVERATRIAGLEGPMMPSDAEDDRADLEAAMDHAARRVDSHAVLRLALALDALGSGIGLGRAALAHLDAALGAGGTRDLALVGRALGVRAAAVYALGRLDEALRDSEMALRLATELSDRRQMGAMSKIAGEVAFQLGELARASDHLERARRIAEERKDERLLSTAHYLLGSLYQSRGDRQRARIEFGVSLAIAVRARDAAGEARAEMGLAWEHLDLGDHAAGRERYDRAIDIAQPLGLERTVRIATGYLGVLHFDAGALTDAEEHLRRAAYACKRAGDPRIEGIFEGIRGGVLAALGRVAEAQRSFALSDQLLVGNPFYRSLIDVHRGHLDLALARAAERRGEPNARATGLAAARARIEAARAVGETGESFVQRSDDARLAVRILERYLVD